VPLEYLQQVVILSNHSKEFIVRSSQQFTKTGSLEVRTNIAVHQMGAHCSRG
jgi:hypothetical protein